MCSGDITGAITFISSLIFLSLSVSIRRFDWIYLSGISGYSEICEIFGGHVKVETGMVFGIGPPV